MARYQYTLEQRPPYQIQMEVIGALVMRELHTRFGRDNVGYLWLLLEPMTLTAAVTAMHAIGGAGAGSEYDLAPFWATGYTPFIMWRGIIGRSEGAFESNRTLIYHRQVTLIDILVSRSILEFLSVASALFIILGFCAAIGFGTLPQRPLYMLTGLVLLWWFSFGIGVCISAACDTSPVVARFVHPAVYLSLPISGAFFSMSWLPTSAQRILGWVPLTHIFEMIRMGQFATYPDTFVDPFYVVAWCMPLTVLGLISLRIVRRSMHLA